MKNKIFDLVEDSHEGDNYLKALECLVALARVASLSSKAIQLPSKHSKEYSGGVNRLQERLEARLAALLMEKNILVLPVIGGALRDGNGRWITGLSREILPL
ncbi:hypothetical protein JHK87_016294 [Glycine soja]|nr:hypothetical protein JHK87_016294 [Glycine soja]